MANFESPSIALDVKTVCVLRNEDLYHVSRIDSEQVRRFGGISLGWGGVQGQVEGSG